MIDFSANESTLVQSTPLHWVMDWLTDEGTVGSTVVWIGAVGTTTVDTVDTVVVGTVVGSPFFRHKSSRSYVAAVFSTYVLSVLLVHWVCSFCTVFKLSENVLAAVVALLEIP